MKIGYFLTIFPYPESFQDPESHRSYPVGGAEIAAYNLAHNMARLGHEVTVFATSVDSRSSVEESNGIKVCRYRKSFSIEKAFFSSEEYLKSVKHDVDIVHLHFTTPPGNLAGWYYAKVKKKPLVITYHGDAIPSYGRLIRRVALNFFDRFIDDRILSRAKFIISPSEYYINESRFLPRYRKKVITIPNGINPQELEVPYPREECRKELSLSVEDRVILFVGALISYKSPDLLIASLPLVIKKVPEAKLVLVGDGPMRQDLERLAAELNISDRIILTGPVVGNRKSLYYKASDIFALPSTLNTEVFPLVLLEASAASLPMVVSSLNTFRCLIEDKFNGVITRTGDIDSLAEAIITLLSQPALMKQMGDNACKKVQDYSWEKIARLTESVYEMAAK
jgi:glycosyltransferase involved in cell wall biosynthesis